MEDLLPADGLSILVARPKVGKGTLARNAALSIARGQLFLGRVTLKTPVLYLAFEDRADDVRDHFARMGATVRDPIFFYFGRSPKDPIVQLREKIQHHAVGFIVVDQLQLMLRLPHTNDYGEIYVALEDLLMLAREAKVHVLTTWHMGHSREGGLGSTAFEAIVDVVLSLTKPGDDDARYIKSMQRSGVPADVDFLLSVWNRVTERARGGRAPTPIYQDVRLIRRVVRDLFTEDVERFVIDSPEEYGRILDLLSSFAPALRSRVSLYKNDTQIFEHFNVERELERALWRKVWLKSGGYIIIDRTEALTVIDVNTGKYVGKTDLASTIFKTNLEAVDEIVRQIILRDIGGIILVDFIDMENERHRKRVLQTLQEAVRRDRAKIHIIDLTQLGLVEITRKRVYQDLEEVMPTPCPYCEGRGRVLSAETMSLRVRREVRRLARTSRARAILVEVHPQVHELLFRDGDGWLRQAENYGRRILVRARDGQHLEPVNITEAADTAALERLDREEILVGAGARRTQLFWLDREPDEAVDISEEEEEEYEHAAARVAGERAGGGLIARLRQLFAVRRAE